MKKEMSPTGKFIQGILDARAEEKASNHTGEKTLVLNKVIDRYPRMLGLLKAAEINLKCLGAHKTDCVKCQIEALLKEIEQ